MRQVNVSFVATLPDALDGMTTTEAAKAFESGAEAWGMIPEAQQIRITDEPPILIAYVNGEAIHMAKLVSVYQAVQALEGIDYYNAKPHKAHDALVRLIEGAEL